MTPQDRLKQDFLRIALLAACAAAAGLAINRTRPAPLGWSHRTKAERLQSEVGGGLRRTGFARIALADLSRELAEGRITLIDARPPLFFRAGHLPGALNLPREGFQAAYGTHRGVLDAAKEKRVVVYCQGSSCEDSELVAAALRVQGFTDLWIFAGGWNEWLSAGLKGEAGA